MIEANAQAATLQARGLSRRFGGIQAVDDVSIDLKRGELHAVIGTNGAGKSTLIDLLAGEMAPSSGRVVFNDRDVTAWSQPRRARAGIGRSYQRNSLCEPFTVFENVRLCAQAKRQRPWALWAAGRACERSSGMARAALAAVGLSERAADKAGTLSHGAKRQLEIAMCLATGPQVLLLDEPLSGLGAEETDRLLALLGELKPAHAVLMVEHDMDAVFRIADRITVMANGRVLASGAPAAIRANTEVRAAYFGEASTDVF